MVSEELEEAAFDYTDGEDLNFSQRVANGIEKEVVIDYLNDRLPDKSFTDEEIKEITDLIISYAEDRVKLIRDYDKRDFKQELEELISYYNDEKELEPLIMCKILIDKANNLFPNV